MSHSEPHKSHRAGWLRAAVLGANDGIISTASLVIGVASAGQDIEYLIFVGLAGLVAGAMSMAAGEYVSVSSQADAEKADLLLEEKALAEDYDSEMDELADIYIQRGVEPSIAIKVAEQLMHYDALGAHARDEIGISEVTPAKPVQAAVFSSVTFSLGAGLPLIALYVANTTNTIAVVTCTSLLALSFLGGLSAIAGGASVIKAALRVGFWGAVAMWATAMVGLWFGSAS